MMLVLLMIFSLVVLLVTLFWPYRSPYVRRTTRTRNGLPYWKDKELY